MTGARPVSRSATRRSANCAPWGTTGPPPRLKKRARRAGAQQAAELRASSPGSGRPQHAGGGRGMAVAHQPAFAKAAAPRTETCAPSRSVISTPHPRSRKCRPAPRHGDRRSRPPASPRAAEETGDARQLVPRQGVIGMDGRQEAGDPSWSFPALGENAAPPGGRARRLCLVVKPVPALRDADRFHQVPTCSGGASVAPGPDRRRKVPALRPPRQRTPAQCRTASCGGVLEHVGAGDEEPALVGKDVKQGRHDARRSCPQIAPRLFTRLLKMPIISTERSNWRQGRRPAPRSARQSPAGSAQDRRDKDRHRHRDTRRQQFVLFRDGGVDRAL